MVGSMPSPPIVGNISPTTFYLLDMSRPIEEPPLFDYEPFQEVLEASEKFHDLWYEHNPPFKTKYFDLKIETYLLLLYTRWADKRKPVLRHADQASNFGFYEVLKKEVLNWLSQCLWRVWHCEEPGKHLRLDTQRDDIREMKREAERIAASQAATEAHSPSVTHTKTASKSLHLHHQH